MNRTRWIAAVTVVALSGLGLWLSRAPESEPAREQDAPQSKQARVPAELAGVAAVENAATVPAHLPLAPRAAPSPPAYVPAGDVAGPHAHDPHWPGMAPHPMNDPVRQRLHAENRLIQTLNDAMSFRRVREMRELLVEYRKLDPNDVDRHQAGYAVIADCIEYPGDRSLARAREFYGAQRHSPLRRFVRRICFENTN